jgi:hypothetical protein
MHVRNFFGSIETVMICRRQIARQVFQQFEFRLARLAMVLSAGFVFVIASYPQTPAAAQRNGTEKTAETILGVLDTDDDGRVSRSEWRKSMKMFDSIDTDGDGILTYEELQARFANSRAPAGRAVEWIDVHAHPTTGRNEKPDVKGAIDDAVSALGSSKVSKMILMPQPMVTGERMGKTLKPVPFESWIGEAAKYPGRIYVMGGGATLNVMIHEESPDGHPSNALKKRFADRAEAILKLGAIGFGEIALTHFSMIADQPYMNTSADHPLLLMLADIAAEDGVVIDVHFDPVGKDIPRPDYMTGDNPDVLQRNIDAFERFLDHNPDAKICWAHVGSDRMNFWTPQFTRDMLEKHPNLYLSLRLHLTPSAQNFPLSPNGIRPEWIETFRRYPDRFVMGSDRFFISPTLQKSGGPAAQFAKLNEGTLELSERFLGYLPPELAEKFAFKNAEQLYGLANFATPRVMPSVLQSNPSPRPAKKAGEGLCRNGNMEHCKTACQHGSAAACARLKRNRQ